MEAWKSKKEALNASLMNISPCPQEQHWVFQRMLPSVLGAQQSLSLPGDAVLIYGLPSVFLQFLPFPFMQVFGPHDGCREAPFPLSLTMP